MTRLSSARTRRSVRVAALCALSLVCATACGIKQYVSASYLQMVAQRSFRADRPIARELRYLYIDNSEIDGKTGNALVSSTEHPSGSGGADVAGIYTGPAQLDLAHADSLSQKAAQASARGDFGGARTYSSLSVASAETADAMNGMVNNSVAMMNAYSSSLQAMQALAEAWHESAGQAITGYVEAQTGCVGDAAPEGSILHLMLTRMMRAKSFQTSSRIELVVRAVLDDGKGGRHVVDRAIEIWTTGDEAAGADVDFVVHEAKTAPRIEALKGHTWGDHLATLAISAVEGVYAKLDEGR